MQYHTHIAFGGVLGLAATQFIPLNENDIIFYGAGVLFGTLLPDIDHPNSKISHKIPILPHIISLLFRHRTFFHSLLFLGLLTLLYSVLPSILITGLLIGVVSHMIGDMMTTKGIQLFFPIRKFISFPVTFKTGGVVEQILFFVFIVVAYQLFKLMS